MRNWIKARIPASDVKEDNMKPGTPSSVTNVTEPLPFKLTDKGELDFQWFVKLSVHDQMRAKQYLIDTQDREGMIQLNAFLQQAVLTLYAKYKEQHPGEKLPNKTLERNIRKVDKEVTKQQKAAQADEALDSFTDAGESTGAEREERAPKKKKKAGCCTIQ